MNAGEGAPSEGAPSGKSPAWPDGWLVRSLDATGSTMDDARPLSAQAARGCVMARSQSAGRGRLPGRGWAAAEGQSLLATYWFPRREFGDAPLPLVAGLAVAKAIDAWIAGAGLRRAPRLSLKWPNDVLCSGKKIAGILCEGSGDAAFAGIGLNCLQTRFEGGYRTAPSSLLIETGRALDPPKLGALIARAFERMTGGHGWKEEYEAMLDGKGSGAAFALGLGSGQVEGIIRGVGEDGALLLETADGVRAFHSGELSSLRPH